MRNAVGEDKQFYENDEVLDGIYKKIEEVTDELSDIENQIQSEMNKMALADEELKNNYAILNSFKGIGTINAVAMLVYTDNFRKYDTANRMATAWGVAPFRNQSGTSLNTPGHVSFYCNHWLKSIITCAANSAISCNHKISNYYNRLLEKGKNKGVAYNNTKSKMIHILFTMIHNQTMYDPEYDVKKKDKNKKGISKMLN